MVKTKVFLSSGNETLFSCKFFEEIFFCFDPQYGRLVTWLQTKNRTGVPFLSIMVYKRVRDRTSGRSLPIKNFVEHPTLPLPRRALDVDDLTEK